MNKYEELKKHFEEEIGKVKNCINDINTSLSYYENDDVQRLSELFDDLAFYSLEFRGLYNRYLYIKTHEWELKTLLDDFIEEECGFNSFTYERIRKQNNGLMTLYFVKDKCFTSPDEAKEYSKSLGEKPYWLYNAIDYLNMNV